MLERMTWQEALRLLPERTTQPDDEWSAYVDGFVRSMGVCPSDPTRTS